MAGKIWTRAALVVAVAMGGTALAMAPAAATASSHFVPRDEVRAYDTRDTGGLLVAGQERRIDLSAVVPVTATRAAVRLTGFFSIANGELAAHPCGAFDPADLYDLAIEARQVTANVVLVPLQARAFCVTASVPAGLVVDVLGVEDPAVAGVAYADTVDTVVFDATVAADGAADFLIAAGGVPTTATAVSLEVRVDGATVETEIYVASCNANVPDTPTVSYVEYGQFAPTITLTATGGLVCLRSFGSDSHVTVRVTGWWGVGAVATADGPPQYRWRATDAPGFVAVNPTRLFDTRESSPVNGGTVRAVDLSADVPVGATSVVMNVTATQPLSAGFVTVYPCDAERPTASNLNYVAGQTVPNLVTVALSADRQVCFYSNATSHLIADLAGYYEVDGGDGLVPTTPARLFDTRDAGSRVPTGGVYELDLSSKVAADASAVVMNVTVTDPILAGFVTVYPCGSARPTASNLNYVAGQTVPNLVTVALPANKHVCFYAHAATHLLADLSASYAASSTVGFFAITPLRQLDTRTDGRPLGAGAAFPLTFGPGVMPGPDQVAAVVLNVTVAEPDAAGYVTVYPCAAGRPTASNLNYRSGDVVPNQVMVAAGDDDQVCFYSQSTSHLVVDEAGYFGGFHDLISVVET